MERRSRADRQRLPSAPLRSGRPRANPGGTAQGGAARHIQRPAVRDPGLPRQGMNRFEGGSNDGVRIAPRVQYAGGGGIMVLLASEMSVRGTQRAPDSLDRTPLLAPYREPMNVVKLILFPGQRPRSVTGFRAMSYPLSHHPAPRWYDTQNPTCAEVQVGLRFPSSGASRARTGDPLLAKQVLSQLSYGPMSPPGGGTFKIRKPTGGWKNHAPAQSAERGRQMEGTGLAKPPPGGDNCLLLSTGRCEGGNPG
jgi:hypothetical protein